MTVEAVTSFVHSFTATYYMRMRSTVLVASILLLGCIGCEKENPEVKDQLKKGGISEQTASELSKMDLTKEETDNLIAARANGLDDASLALMVETMHDNDL